MYNTMAFASKALYKEMMINPAIHQSIVNIINPILKAAINICVSCFMMLTIETTLL